MPQARRTLDQARGASAADMRRREFVRDASCAGAALACRPPGTASGCRGASPWLLVPMDDAQSDHLKAYGLAFRVLERGGKGGVVPQLPRRLLPAARRRRDRRGTPRSRGSRPSRSTTRQLVQIRGEIQGGNMDAVPLEKAPKVAVYAPPNAAPWDDAVTMALNYAGIKFEKIWDPEVLGQGLKTYDWLHLHHEDFTGQYSKFFLNYAGAPWLVEMVERNRTMARTLGFPRCRRRSAPWRWPSPTYVERGGFLFAMCTATETLDLALARRRRGHRGGLRRRHADGPGRHRAGCTGTGRSRSRTPGSS